MKKRFFALCAVLVSVVCSTSAQKQTLLSGGEGYHSKWVVESQTENPVTVIGDSIDVVAARGVTLWYDKKFKGDYQISYSAKFVMEGGEHDRLSDLNCFWGAIDPKYPKDFYKQSRVYRDGDFSTYSPLDLFYVDMEATVIAPLDLEDTTVNMRRWILRRIVLYITNIQEPKIS